MRACAECGSVRGVSQPLPLNQRSRGQRGQKAVSQGKTSICQGCQTDRSTLKPSSLAPVKVNHLKIAVGQGVKVPYLLTSLSRNGRKYRGNRTSNTNSPARGNNNSGGYTLRNSNGTLFEDSNLGRKVHANVGTANRAGRRERRRNHHDGKNRHGRCNYCQNSTEHGWHDCPLRLSHQESGGTYHVNTAQVNSQWESISHAWCTQVQAITRKANVESFEFVDDGRSGRLASGHVPVQGAPETAKQDMNSLLL